MAWDRAAGRPETAVWLSSRVSCTAGPSALGSHALALAWVPVPAVVTFPASPTAATEEKEQQNGVGGGQPEECHMRINQTLVK